MPSSALSNWNTVRASSLDQIEEAHRAIEGAGPGRRYATLQVNHAYTVMLASQFQGFCRDLHSECVEWIVAHAVPTDVGLILRDSLKLNRKLDRENANPGNLGSDFNRLGFAFWDEMKSRYSRTSRRIERLSSLNDWRNAIAHQEFSKIGGDPSLLLQTVRTWRMACRSLATSFDAVMRDHLSSVTGKIPW